MFVSVSKIDLTLSLETLSRWYYGSPMVETKVRVSCVSQPNLYTFSLCPQSETASYLYQRTTLLDKPKPTDLESTAFRRRFLARKLQGSSLQTCCSNQTGFIPCCQNPHSRQKPIYLNLIY